MKLKDILDNKILISCKYRNGARGEEFLARYQSCDFEMFEQWTRMASVWEYTDLPGWLSTLAVFSVERQCSSVLVLRVLEKLRYPNLQCAVLTYISDVSYLKQLFAVWINDKKKSKSVLWALLEIWHWRLRITAEASTTMGLWLKNDAVDIINDFIVLVLQSGHAKEFIMWLFAKGYYSWHDTGNDVLLEKQLLLLMEGDILYNWTDDMLDIENINMDYLTFVATKVDEKYPLNKSSVEKVLTNYNNCINKKQLACVKLPIEKNALEWMNGYAKMFWKNNEQYIQKEIEKNIENRKCVFERWKIKGKIHDYHSVQQENFIFCSFLLMLKHRIKDLNLRKMLFNLISEHLFRQVHVCGELYQEYYSLALCIGRKIVSSISDNMLETFDNRLIEEHRNLENVLTVLIAMK